MNVNREQLIRPLFYFSFTKDGEISKETLHNNNRVSLHILEKEEYFNLDTYQKLRGIIETVVAY